MTWLDTAIRIACCGGQARIRTLEADGNRFTVCPLWPLGYLPEISSAKYSNFEKALVSHQ